VSYNPATGKVQVVVDGPRPGDDCSECVVTPLQIDVTFKDVVIGDGCGTAVFVGPDIDFSYTDILDINHTFRLTQDPDVGEECHWQLTPNLNGVPIVGGTRTQYASSNGSCTGVVATKTFTNMNIHVNIASGVVKVFLDFDSDFMFSDFTGYTPTDCVVGVATNDNDNPFETAMWDGTATITEV
jgi:hypothetical protein